MKKIRSIHEKAMDLAESAQLARARGEDVVARNYLQESLANESAAAWLAVKANAPEPTRTILLKSAAHLAIDCQDMRLAERLISAALAGDPPSEFVDELRSMFEQVNFSRHLDLHGVILQPNDMQMVIAGNAVAPGMASSDEFVDRVVIVQKLIYRTSESDRQQPYRDRGDPNQQIGRSLQLFLSVPRAASFAVSLKVASEKTQGEFEFAESAMVLDRLMQRLELFDREDLDALHRELPVKEYFENFIDLASDLAPDGDKVRLVGLTTVRNGAEKRLEMKRVAKVVKDTVFIPSNERRDMKGRVYFVNVKDEENPIIKLETEDGSEWRLKVDQAGLQKAVQYAGRKSQVIVSGVQVGKTVLQAEKFRAVRKLRVPKR